MAATLRCALAVEASSVSRAAALNRPASTAPLVSTFSGAPLAGAAPALSSRSSAPARRSALVRAAVATEKRPSGYELPTWARFELGVAPVFWETVSGGPPASGELMTIWFNPEASGLTPNPDFGVAFNGGFNSPIMCGSEARRMSRKDRGPNCSPLFSIRVNMPKHAKSIEFSLTDGTAWDGPYVIQMAIPPALRNQPMSYFNEGLAKEMSEEGACDEMIFPDSSYVPDRCLMPGGMDKEEGLTCSLDIVAGCMDPDSPVYDPFATVDDGCPIDLPQK